MISSPDSEGHPAMLHRRLAAPLAAIVLVFGTESPAAEDPWIGWEATRSRITTINLDGSAPKVVLDSLHRRYSAPEWTPDGTSLIVNGGGKLWRLPATGGARADRDRHGDTARHQSRDLPRRPNAGLHLRVDLEGPRHRRPADPRHDRGHQLDARLVGRRQAAGLRVRPGERTGPLRESTPTAAPRSG